MRYVVLAARFEACAGGVVASKLRSSVLVGRCCGGSGRLAVLVDESVAGGVSSDRSTGPMLDNVRLVWCALVKAAVGSVGVVVLDVLA
jgi:hypothetical protein